MEKFEFLDNNVFITNNFDINSLHDFVEMANENDLGFNLMSHSFPYPYTEEDALFFIDQEREMGGEIFSLDLYIYFNGRIAGVIGLKDIDYLNNRAHIGYWIGKNIETGELQQLQSALFQMWPKHILACTPFTQKFWLIIYHQLMFFLKIALKFLELKRMHFSLKTSIIRHIFLIKYYIEIF